MPPPFALLRSAARSTSTKRSSCAGLWGSGYRKPRTRAGRPVHRQHLHGHARGRRQEPPDDPPACQTKPGRADRRDGLLRHARAGGSRRAAGRGRRWSPTSASCPTCWADSAWSTCRRASRASTRRQRAYVKVQDGCLLRCSFCIIPHVRPQLASRPVRAHSRRGPPAGRPRLSRNRAHRHSPGPLRRRMEPRPAARASGAAVASGASSSRDLPGDFRMRLSSIEATEVTRELIDVMAAIPNRSARTCISRCRAAPTRCCGGCGGDGAAGGLSIAADWCRSARQPAITTDIIVGFPGETDADFEATCHVTGSRLLEDPHLPVQPLAAARPPPKCPIKCPSMSSKLGHGS